MSLLKSIDANEDINNFDHFIKIGETPKPMGLESVLTTGLQTLR